MLPTLDDAPPFLPLQGSTQLWEAVPAHDMDISLKLHHRLLRQLVRKYGGYESATEGDSFIIAFRCGGGGTNSCLCVPQRGARYPPLFYGEVGVGRK